MRSIIYFFLVVVLWGCLGGGDQNSQRLPIFPEAIGFGTDTIGGRGGQIITVTNLKDSGEGSLRSAVEAVGPRVIIFEVGGYIDLEKELAITNPYITIAGQSAPPPGITLRNRRLRIGTHDVFIQHLRSRPGDAYGTPDEYDDRDALTIQDYKNEIYNVVIDHCSFSWAIDEVIGIWGYNDKRLSDITISNSIISEGLSLSLKGFPHSKGILIGDYAKNILIVGNLISSSDDRNGPLFKGGSSGVVANNLVYNSGQNYWIGLADDYNSGPIRISVVGNVWMDGKNSNIVTPVYVNKNVKSGTMIYLSGNIQMNFDGSLKRNLFRWNGKEKMNFFTYIPPVYVQGLEVKSPHQVVSHVLKNAGARPGERFQKFGDKIDKRIVKDVLVGEGKIINSVDDVGGWPIIKDVSRKSLPLNYQETTSNQDKYTNVEKNLFLLAKEVEGCDEIGCEILFNKLWFSRKQ